ncbi:hypothetical protein E4T39_01991 [Aureobasidium subglaciale]|nr:hypothetical protein E4T39_01991 [Aureobasidium subglaciale]
MPRPPIDLSAHRQTITWWITQEKWQMDRVMAALESEHSISLSANTLKRNLNAWGISIRPRIKVTAEMRQRIYDLFYQERYYTDQQMAKLLRRDGFTISFRKLAKLRKEMGLSKRKDTIIPEKPVVPGEVIQVEDDDDTSHDGEEDDDDVEDDEDDTEVNPMVALENSMRRLREPHQPVSQPSTQVREPAWRKKKSSNSIQPIHQAPKIPTTYTDSRHSPPAPAPAVPSPSPSLNPLPESTDANVYYEPPANGQGLARRVTTLVARIEAIETENTGLKQQAEQQRVVNLELRQLVQQQRIEMDMLRGSLNELIARFNSAHY